MDRHAPPGAASRGGWPGQRGFATLTIAHTTLSMAYVAVIVQSRLRSMDQSVEEAAMDLGGRPLRVAVDITLPLVTPALVAGWLLAFTLPLDDLVVASFVSGPGASTLPMYIFSKVKLGVSPDINALATLVIALVTAGVLLAWRVGSKRRVPGKARAEAIVTRPGPGVRIGAVAEVDVFIASMKRCLASPEFLLDSYALFMDSSEEVPKKFAKTDIKKQTRVLADSFWAISVAAQGPRTSPTWGDLPRLAARHSGKDLDIRPGLYDTWLECLIQAVRKHDKLVCEEVEAAWRKTLSLGIEYMRAKY